MEEIDIHAKLAQIETAPHFSMIFDGDTEKAEMIAEHPHWCFLPLFATIYAKGGESHEENHHPADSASDERVFGVKAC